MHPKRKILEGNIILSLLTLGLSSYEKIHVWLKLVLPSTCQGIRMDSPTWRRKNFHEWWNWETILHTQSKELDPHPSSWVRETQYMWRRFFMSLDWIKTYSLFLSLKINTFELSPWRIKHTFGQITITLIILLSLGFEKEYFTRSNASFGIWGLDTSTLEHYLVCREWWNVCLVYRLTEY